MKVKKAKKKIVEVETGEEIDVQELLDAKENLLSKLDKAYSRKESAEADIQALELAIKNFDQELEEAGYEPSEETEDEN